MAKTEKKFIVTLKSDGTKRTYTASHFQYRRGEPVEVNEKTARYLKNTGLFKIKKA